MSEAKRDPLDQALAALPREVQPERDLWPAIHAEIAKTPIVTDAAPVVERSFRWYQAAAAVLLVVASSVTTYVVTRQSVRNDVARAAPEALPTPALTAMPASFGQHALGADYLKARAELDKTFEERVAALPPPVRAKLQRNLADLRHAAREISATLAEHPSDPLLQELLMSTYQSELQLLADVSEMSPTNPRVDL
jgi:hypothetical protein